MKVPNLPEFLPQEIKDSINKDAEKIQKELKKAKEIDFSEVEIVDEGTFFKRLIKTFKDLYN